MFPKIGEETLNHPIWWTPAINDGPFLVSIWVLNQKYGCLPPNHPFVHSVFHEINHPFGGTVIFGNTHMDVSKNRGKKKNKSSHLFIGFGTIINSPSMLGGKIALFLDIP